MADAKTSLSSTLNQLDTVLDEYLLKKAPSLPTNVKEIIVKIAPYLTILGVLFSLPGILMLLGMGAVLAPLSMYGGVQAAGAFSFMVIFLIIIVVLEALAIPGLFSRSKQGWTYVYWSALVGAVYNVVSLNIFGLIIGTLLSLYFLYQVKSYYK